MPLLKWIFNFLLLLWLYQTFVRPWLAAQFRPPSPQPPRQDVRFQAPPPAQPPVKNNQSDGEYIDYEEVK